MKNPGTILIIDDVIENLQLLTQLLTQKGYRVRATKSGNEGITSCHAEPPDLVLLDIKLGDISGYDVCTALKTSKETSDIPIIFLSGLGESSEKIKGFNLGAVDYITKPFVTQEVFARVQTHVSLNQLRIENDKKSVELKFLNLQLQAEIKRHASIEIMNKNEKKNALNFKTNHMQSISDKEIKAFVERYASDFGQFVSELINKEDGLKILTRRWSSIDSAINSLNKIKTSEKFDNDHLDIALEINHYLREILYLLRISKDKEIKIEQ